MKLGQITHPPNASPDDDIKVSIIIETEICGKPVSLYFYDFEVYADTSTDNEEDRIISLICKNVTDIVIE